MHGASQAAYGNNIPVCRHVHTNTRTMRKRDKWHEGWQFISPNSCKQAFKVSTTQITHYSQKQLITTFKFLYGIFFCSRPVSAIYFKGVTSHCQERTNTYTMLSDTLACFLNQNSAKLLRKSNYLVALLWYNSNEVILRPPVTPFPILLFIT